MYVMNKNVNHSGTLYAKGAVIKAGDPGFEALVQAGHADKVEGKAEAPQAPAAEPVMAPEADEAEQVADKKPARKGRHK